MINSIRNIKNKPLVLVFLLYIITSYVCQETLLPSKINSLFLLVFVGLAFCYRIQKRNYVDKHFSIWYLILLLYSLFSALLMSNDVFYTLYQMLVVFVLTFCFGIVITNRKTLELTIVTYVISAVLMGILIMYYNPMYLIENVSGLGGMRLGQEETGNANIFTALMMFSGVFASWLILYNKNVILRVCSAFSLVLILYLMALSGGRKTIIAVVACTMFFVWKKGAYSIKKKVFSLFVICIVLYSIVYMMMTIPWLYDVVGYRFDGLFSFVGGTGESNVTSDDLRKEMIEMGFQGWTEKPIFGHGLDSFKFFNKEMTGHMFYSHNNYVEMLYDFGIIGFLYYYIFIYKLYIRLKKLPKEFEIYSILGIGILLELLFFDIGGVAYYINGNMIMLCIVSLIAYSPRLINKEEK